MGLITFLLPGLERSRVTLRIRRLSGCGCLGSEVVVIPRRFLPYLMLERERERALAVLAHTDWTSLVFFKLIAALHEKRGLDTDYYSQTAVCTNRQAIDIWARRGRFLRRRDIEGSGSRCLLGFSAGLLVSNIRDMTTLFYGLHGMAWHGEL